MANPIISVCCITYNHAPYIRQALDSVLMQETEYPFEIIIHDDASTDGTTEIVHEYERRYPDIIKPIYQRENQYSKDPRVLKNFLYPKAKGKYIALLECDDYWTDPNKLQKQVCYMETHPECSGTFHASNWITDGKIIRNDCHFREERNITPQQVIVGGGEYCATASLCFRSQYALDYPSFRQMDEICDYSLEILLPLRGIFHYFPDIMCHYRFGRSGSWTASMKNDQSKRYHSLQKTVAWLKQLDKDTAYQYSTEIYYKIGKENCVLYLNGVIPFSELTECLSHMKWGKLKLLMLKKCYERYIKTGFRR